MIRGMLALIALAMSPLPALAADCSKANTQLAMNECAQAEYKHVDDDLNRAYQALMKKLVDNQPAQDLLRTAEVAWIAYRDKECAFQSSGVAGGSLQPTIEEECLSAVTKLRVAALNYQLKCGEGDPNCPQ